MYWALDYIDERECELVYNDQLYDTQEAAEEARQEMRHPELFETNWYSYGDLLALYNQVNFTIDDQLHINILK